MRPFLGVPKIRVLGIIVPSGEIMRRGGGFLLRQLAPVFDWAET